MNQVVTFEPPEPRPADACEALKVESLDLYYGAAHALRSVSLTATIGKVTCILGRNGVGKTSLLRAIAGHLPIAAGRVFWRGEEISKKPAHMRARMGLAYVPQGREIFPLLSVRENLMTGYSALKKEERFVPKETLDLFPVLNGMMHRRGGDLSGGQQQQLAIARALVMRPKLLLLDEPTEGIQPSIIKDIARAIRYLKSTGQMAIVLVEQYFEFARELADEFIVIERGSVVMSGDAENMAEGEVRRYMSV